MWATEDPATAATLCLEWQPDVIVLELGLPPQPAKPDLGVKLLQDIRKHGCVSKIIVYTHLFDRDQAIRALWLGVHDVLKAGRFQYA